MLRRGAAGRLLIKRIRRVLERYGLDVTVRQAHPGNRGQIVVWS